MYKIYKNGDNPAFALKATNGALMQTITIESGSSGILYDLQPGHIYVYFNLDSVTIGIDNESILTKYTIPFTEIADKNGNQVGSDKDSVYAYLCTYLLLHPVNEIDLTFQTLDPPLLEVGTTTGYTVPLTWNLPTNADIIEIFRNTSKTITGATKIYSASGLSFTDTGLTVSSKYYYFIVASGYGYNDSSPGFAVATTATPTLDTPTLAVTNTSPTDNSLSWTSSAYATSYDVYRNVTNNFATATFLTNITGTAYDDMNVSAGNTYDYFVVAKAAGYNNSNPAQANITIPIAIGTLYSKTSWGDLTDFVEPFGAGTSGASISSGKVRFSGGTGSFNKFLGINRYSNLPYWKMTAIVKIVSNGSTDYGFGAGTFANNPYKTASDTNMVVGRYEVYNGGTSGSGHVDINLDKVSTAATHQFTSATTLTNAVGDYITLVVQRSNMLITVTATNQTSGLSVTNTYTYSYGTSALQLPTTGYLGFYNLGGTADFQSIIVETTVASNNNIVFLGDSKTQLYAASAGSTLWTNMVASHYSNKICTNLGGGYDRTSDILNRMPEVLKCIQPGTRVVLEIGSNDIRTGVSAATALSNLQSITSQLTNAGALVTQLLFEESSIDLTSFNNSVKTAYPNSYVDANLNTATDLAGDGIHPNDNGNAKAYNVVTAALGTF